MTISATTTVQKYIGTGANTVLSTVFPFFVASDIIVTQRVTATGVATLMTLGVHYTVTGGSSVGAVGTVTPIAGATDFPVTVSWAIERAIPITQDLSYIENDVFPAVSHEAGLDRLTMQSQDREARLDRTLSFGVSETDGAADYDAGSNQIINLAAPVLNGDAVNKGYADALVEGVTIGAVTATGSVTSRLLADRWAAPVVHVEDYGVTMDGVTDDSAAFQLALDAAGGTLAVTPGGDSGGIVQIPRGRMFLASAVVVPSYVTVQGMGASLTAFEGSEIRAASDISIFTSDTTAGGYTRNVVIRDLQIRNTIGGVAKTKYEIDLFRPTNCKIDNVWLNVGELTITDVGGALFNGGGEAAGAGGPFLNTVQNCVFSGGSVIFECSDSHVFDSFIWGHHRPYTVAFLGFGGGVHGCELIGNITRGAVYALNTSGGIRIIDNFFDGSNAPVNSGKGVELVNANHSLIQGNRFGNQTDDAVYLEDTSYCTIIGNTFHNCNRDETPAGAGGKNDIRISGVATGCFAVVVMGNTHKRDSAHPTLDGQMLSIEDNGTAPGQNQVAYNVGGTTNYVASTVDGTATTTIMENRGYGLNNVITYGTSTSFVGGAKFGAGSALDGDAILELVSTTQAFVLPRMTATEMDPNIPTPRAGMVVYNTTTNTLYFYNGSAWGAV